MLKGYSVHVPARPTVNQRSPKTTGRVVAGFSVLHTAPSAGWVPWMRAASTALLTHVLVPYEPCPTPSRVSRTAESRVRVMFSAQWWGVTGSSRPPTTSAGGAPAPVSGLLGRSLFGAGHRAQFKAE